MFADTIQDLSHGQVMEQLMVKGTSMGGVPREQNMLKGHLPRVIDHRIYLVYEDKIFLTIDDYSKMLARGPM